MKNIDLLFGLSLCVAVLCPRDAVPAQAADPTAILKLRITDTADSEMPCRVHLTDEQGEAVFADGLPHWDDHFVCPGRAQLSLAPQRIRYQIERGPEFERLSGTVTLNVDQPTQLEVSLRRITDLRQSGWYSGDLHVHRPVEDVPLLMRAEDLDIAPVITWWNTRNAWQNDVPAETLKRLPEGRLYDVMAGEDEREGGALLYFGLKSPLNIQADTREFPSPMAFVERARRLDSQVWIDIEKPFWWDVPVWLASGRMNSIGIANNHMCRSRMYEDEAWGRPRNAQRLPAPRGNGFWTQEIYYHMLNAGLRVPPSAGSASGVLPNPVGYNRVYVYVEESFGRDEWFQGLARGESFVTNGPLLLATLDEQHPGAVLSTSADQPRMVTIDITAVSNDPLAKLEIIHNGRVLQTIDCNRNSSISHSSTVSLSAPGWILVRAMADVGHTFRFASTAPWFVQDDSRQAHISRQACQFFLDWVDERTERVKSTVNDDFQRPEVLRWHEMARNFWLRRLAMANTD